MTYKRVAINTAVVMGTLALVYLMWVFRQAFLLFVFFLSFLFGLSNNWNIPTSRTTIPYSY